MRDVKSVCRVCHAGCGVTLTIDNDERIASIRGDKDNTMSNGYACFKGIYAGDAHHGPERLRHALKRQADGSHAPIASEQALNEIADKIRVIRDRYGPRSVALYSGGGGFFSGANMVMIGGFLHALGTDQIFTPGTIDQPNKDVSVGRLGTWPAGPQDLDHSDVVLLLGTNPLVSHLACGLLVADATRVLKAAKARGLKIICIDPRLTETARFADLFLQPLPGQDSAILAGLIRIILAEDWGDRDFCEHYVGAAAMADLRAAVAPFTAEMVERRAGLEPGQLYAVAALFARDHKAGPAVMTTGPSFAPFANLTQHLLDVLNIVCGRMKRAGDKVRIDMLSPPKPIYAEVTPPHRSWEKAPPSRIRGAGTFASQKLTATLPEEILTPGDGQIRCLIMIGGNPAAVVPDQPLMHRALHSLELSVTVDPWFTSSAQLSDYVIAPKMSYERADLNFAYPGLDLQTKTYAQFTPAVIPPPAGADVIDDWYFLWSLAGRLGLQINYAGVDLDMTTVPATEELLSIRLAHSRVTLEELRRYPSGKEFDHPDCTVLEIRPESAGRFDVMPDDVAQELKEFHATPSEPGRYSSNGRDFEFLMTSRRSRYIYNSTLNQLAEVRKHLTYTPAFIHPGDMAEKSLTAGEVIEIESDYGKILAVAEPDETMRRGVISVVHGVTSPAHGADLGRTNVNALIDATRNYNGITAMPRMSAIPIDIRPARFSNSAGAIPSAAAE